MPRTRNKNGIFYDSLIENQFSWRNYFDQLIEIAIGRFNWINLPDTVDARYLEMKLCTNGYALFFEDPVLGYLALQCTIGGRLNVYDVPINRRAFSNSGYQADRQETNSVIIWNNQIRNNMAIKLMEFSKDLYELDNIVMINAKAQKTPVMILSDEKQRLTLKNLYMKYDGNQPFIFANKNTLSPDSIQALNTGAPWVADKVYQLKVNIWNEALTFLGIPNVSVNKKERMITDEVTRAQGGVFASRYSCLNARKQACNEINNMFGLNIDVEFRQESDTDTEEGGEEHGNVYDNDSNDAEKLE